MPRGGIRMAETTLKENGYEPDPAVHEIFTKYVTTVNDGIFRAYTSNIRRARHAHTVTGLPDAYLVDVSSGFMHVWLFTVLTT